MHVCLQWDGCINQLPRGLEVACTAICFIVSAKGDFYCFPGAYVGYVSVIQLGMIGDDPIRTDMGCCYSLVKVAYRRQVYNMHLTLLFMCVTW